MDIALTRTTVEVKLSPFENITAFRRGFSIPRSRVVAASVDPTPMRSIHGRFTLGLRAPGFIFVGSGDRGRHFWAIRNNVPALHLELRSGSGGRRRRLQRITVCTRDAEALAAELTQGARTAHGDGANAPAAASAKR